jgi:predicted enzyme related to lactoylglutathione lyase
MADNKVIHFEIVGKDGPALQKFYSDLFGWNLDTNNPGGYGMSSANQTGVVVGVGASPDGSSGHVTGYVAVADVDAALARATELGGRVIMPKYSPGPGAVLGLLADPEGHVLGVTEL